MGILNLYTGAKPIAASYKDSLTHLETILHFSGHECLVNIPDYFVGVDHIGSYVFNAGNQGRYQPGI